jgi:cytochrome b6-f complex subunit 4
MTDTSTEKDSIPFFPDHVRTEFRVVLGILVVVFAVALWGLIKPVGLGAPADPLDTPTHVKPEWYFLALYQMLKFIPKTIGATLPVVAVIVLILWPFIERKPDKSSKIYRYRFIFVAVALVILIAMTIWGEVS